MLTKRRNRKEEQAKREAHKAECVAIAEGKKCPQCGRGLKYNNALAGTHWFQCVGFGAEGFRQGEPCSFQILWAKD